MTRPRWFAVLAGLALVALGVGVFLVGSARRPIVARVRGANVPVDPGARDLRDITANNSPSLVASRRNPAVLAVSNRVDTPAFSCSLHTSADGGRAWRAVPVPFPPGEEQPPRCYAPDVAFDADGALRVSFVTLAGRGNTPHAAWVSSAPAGSGGEVGTLGPPNRIAGPLSFQVRLAADPGRPGRLWAAWVAARDTVTLGLADADNPVVVARSDDGGATWSPPQLVTTPARPRVLAPTIRVGTDGVVHVLALDVGDDRLDYSGAHEGRGGPPYAGRWSLASWWSADEGRSWSETVVEPALVPYTRFVSLFPPSPSLALGPAGRVYAAFADGGSGNADVKLWTSTDNGARFGAGRRVNDTTTSDGTSQYLPSVAVAPDGRLDVVYYDRRADAADVTTEVSLQTSFDGGATFGHRLRLSDKGFDSRVGFGSERGLADLGSRLGLVAADGEAVAVWSDTRAGTEASGKQDLARALVTFAAPRSWSWLRPVGGIAALIGLLTLAGTARRREERTT